MDQQLISQQFEEAQQVLAAFSTAENFAKISQAIELMSTALSNGHKIICDAMHFAEELSGRYRENRKALAAIAISDPSHISCVSNDFGYDFVFSRFIEGLGQPGDVLLGISTSGNSANIIKAVETAQQKGMEVVLLTGKDGGKLAGYKNVTEIRVEHVGYADRIQEIHIKVIHILILLIEKGLML